MSLEQFKKEVPDGFTALNVFEYLLMRFESLTLKQINQRKGYFGEKKGGVFSGGVKDRTLEDVENKECGACFGWWIAYFLDIRTTDRYYFPTDKTDYVLFSYDTGRDVFNFLLKTLGLNESVWREKLGKLAGVGFRLFGSNKWDAHPKKVLPKFLEELYKEKNLTL